METTRPGDLPALLEQGWPALVSGLLSIDEHLVTPGRIITVPGTLIGSHFHTPDDEEQRDDE